MTRTIVWMVLLGLAAAACDDHGPGEFAGTVRGQAGAVVVELTGPGITGVGPVGATRAYGAPGAVDGTYRVLLVAPVASDLRFTVTVADQSEGPPSGRVVSAADGRNRPVSPAGLIVSIEES